MQKLAVAFVCTLLCLSLVNAKQTLKIEIHPQSNNWWLAVTYKDAAFTTSTIEVQQSGFSEWVEMRSDNNPWWNYWVYTSENGNPFCFPLSFRLTAANGAQVTLTGAVTAFTGKVQVIDSLVQYLDSGVVSPTDEPTVPTTDAPATDAPATEAPATDAPATGAPATEAPATEAPATEAPATEAPATEAPATEAPATEAPTDAPATDAPATDSPATDSPATDSPVTDAPATDAPATDAPATEAPATAAPTSAPTGAPTDAPTSAPTAQPATDAPTAAPTSRPTDTPTERPATAAPTAQPTDAPTVVPTAAPTARATIRPSVAATSVPVAGTCSAKTKIIVPLYVYPGAAWDTIAAGASKVETVAIVNPASGPTATPNSAYVTYMNKMNAAGVDMIGYVYTGWGNRAMSAVKADINTYAQNWPLLKGIFLDEGAATSDKEAYYKELYDYILGMPGWSYDVINPGTPPTAGYYDAATTIVSLENYGSEGAGSTPSYASCDRKEKFSAIVHSVSSGSMASIIDTLLSKQYFGYIYVTDGAGGCCTYNALTSYYTNMVNYIASKN